MFGFWSHECLSAAGWSVWCADVQSISNVSWLSGPLSVLQTDRPPYWTATCQWSNLVLLFLLSCVRDLGCCQMYTEHLSVSNLDDTKCRIFHLRGHLIQCWVMCPVWHWRIFSQALTSLSGPTASLHHTARTRCGRQPAAALERQFQPRSPHRPLWPAQR